MREQVVYLDSSAIVKRYVEEPGSGRTRETFLNAYSGNHLISYSVWNVGEVLGVLDRARSLGRIEVGDYDVARERFLSETRRMSRLGLALVVPVRNKILSEAWRLLEKCHVYEADALQIATAKYVNSVEFITGDKALHEVAIAEDLRSTYLG